ncbi:glycoside hydrolase [Coccomyxa subellipsoidea C-169]|uniref:Trehalase n=1 Tax=Coccomyxa subellipsoidea (strain C-169) TaxID=574566 RepID=I0YTW7_COCSC|nr:glycoside hydrolase [Coccomyxa subellipsoidea C-169]EIE21836.1 glycoside hydrolase [Coccomyxa subellipsoidea C-169]|eukprot:XP_005646380.1 glycoside hydrolase [Coccomyxa subellipsoidea C-169]
MRSDLDDHMPQDFNSDPCNFMPEIEDEEVKAWALALHCLWPQLCRKVADSVQEQPERHTLLPLPGYFFIPGQRFRELYYWDTYWVVKGLLVSQMPASAETVVKNLLHLLQEHGHVPNGSRSYYLNRSQPPLLSSMVSLIYEAKRDTLFLLEAFEALQQEYKYWNQPPKAVRLVGPNGSTVSLSRYYANTTQPRPESYREDVATAALLGGSKTEAEGLFRDIASAAESGWDFSSRWMADGRSLASLQTTRVIPADLNAFLFKFEFDMARFAEILGKPSLQEMYSSASESRRSAMNALMWHESSACWKDLILDRQPPATGVFASSYIPLWTGVAAPGSEQATRCLNSLQASGLMQRGGIATSLSETGQQWDGRNAWPPLQAMLIEAAEAVGRAQMRASPDGRLLAQAWLETCFAAWRKHRQMFEKYDASKPGDPGGDGEYPVQAGFGWTNGVALSLLQDYGWNP